jgi:DNA-binding CsgD family transcriptional regulator
MFCWDTAGQYPAAERAMPFAMASWDAPLLTPQESQIARMAAAGLTNKEIAERLCLSPRTVGGPLYRVSPKLGITSRAALRDSLQALADRGDGGARRPN